uniref:Pentraxin family member n=1 Tax=Erpetoichthys calabaricus TaxID=27687 RepID=A0A8C4TC31_ERPCA
MLVLFHFFIFCLFFSFLLFSGAMQLPVLTFPNANHTKHAKVQLTFPALHAVTVCSRVQWDTKASHVSTIFSYASPSFINEFQLRGQKDQKGDISLALIVHGHHTAYRTLFENDGMWHHVCVTWQNSNGKWAIFVDGKEGHSGVNVHSLQNIEGNGVFIIGQDQDVLGGNFSDAFSGNISDLNIWSEVLDKKQIEGVESCALIISFFVHFLFLTFSIHSCHSFSIAI